MPKGLKNAPPQQSSLLDMWSKGKRKAVSGPKKEEEDVVPENNNMEVNKPGALHIEALGSLLSCVSSRRKLIAG